MIHKSNYQWCAGKEIDAHIERTIFWLTTNDYTWKKKLSIRPRRCYYTGNYIRPFSYAMLAPLAGTAFNGIERKHIYRWISMSAYIILKLKGKL